MVYEIHERADRKPHVVFVQRRPSVVWPAVTENCSRVSPVRRINGARAWVLRFFFRGGVCDGGKKKTDDKQPDAETRRAEPLAYAGGDVTSFAGSTRPERGGRWSRIVSYESCQRVKPVTSASIPRVPSCDERFHGTTAYRRGRTAGGAKLSQ